MDLVSIILFLVVYYIRPQEWIGGVAVLQPVKLVMAFAILAMFTRRGGVAVRDMFKTPHDWMMLAFFLWIIATAPNAFNTLKSCYSLYVTYLVAVQAFSSLDRIQRFLNWWTIMIMVVAGLALASEYGFDPMGGYDLTHGAMQDRLVLNTSIFNNPNALGHSVTPVVMMLYFILFWERPSFMKVAAVPLVSLPLYCLYLTVSKGSFLSCFATIVGGLTFGRSRKVQLIVLGVALTLGWAGLTQLPRMSELDRAKHDEAIQGRVAAFKFGMEMLKTKTTGLGYDGWGMGFLRANRYSKASHSSYVQIGGELGWTGLFLYLGILYCSLRVLLTVRTTSIEEERVRRILFVLICSFMISSWMVNFTYRTTFFLMAAAVAAFHRHLLKKNQPPEPERGWISANAWRPLPIGIGGLRPALANRAALLDNVSQTVIVPPVAGLPGGALPDAPVELSQSQAVAPVPQFLWNRIGLLDLAVILVMTVSAVQFWRYMIGYM